MLYKPSNNSRSIQVLPQQIRGGGKTCADLADTGGGVQNLGKPADVKPVFVLNMILNYCMGVEYDVKLLYGC